MPSNIREARAELRGLNDEMSKSKKLMGDLTNSVSLYLALSRRMGLPPEFTRLATNAMRAKQAIVTLQTSIQLFYASTGPLGWVLAAGGLVLGGLMAADLATEAYEALETERRGEQW